MITVQIVSTNPKEIEYLYKYGKSKNKINMNIGNLNYEGQIVTADISPSSTKFEIYGDMKRENSQIDNAIEVEYEVK